MECYYDTLFEVDCAGVQALGEVPCEFWNITTVGFRTQWGLYAGFPSLRHPKFDNRLKWIGQCKQIYICDLYHSDNLHKNTSTYFLKVYSVWGPVKYSWGMGTGGVALTPPACYYLGRYPNFWNPYNRSIAYAHNLGGAWIADPTAKGYREVGPLRSIFEADVGKLTMVGYRPVKNIKELVDTGVQAMGTEPFIPQREMIDYDKRTLAEIRDLYGAKALNDFFHPELLDPKDAAARAEELAFNKKNLENALWEIAAFYTKGQISTYYDMVTELERREAAYQNCLARNYPQKPYVPQKKVPTPAGPADWPGEPLENMERPAPQKPYLTTSATLTTFASISEDTRVSALELIIWYEDSEAAKEGAEALTLEVKPSGPITGEAPR